MVSGIPPPFCKILKIKISWACLDQEFNSGLISWYVGEGMSGRKRLVLYRHHQVLSYHQYLNNKEVCHFLQSSDLLLKIPIELVKAPVL